MSVASSINALVPLLQADANSSCSDHLVHVDGIQHGNMLILSENPASPSCVLNKTFQDFANNKCNEEDGESEPLAKRFRPEEPSGSDNSSLSDESLKEMLKEIYQGIVVRLNSLEKKVESVVSRCHFMQQKVDSMTIYLLRNGIMVQSDVSSFDVVETDKANKAEDTSRNTTGSSLITLNSEGDFPEGSWLGDETNPNLRVRCCISEDDLAFINKNCHTAEKMALTLLDYLFDRETQACSNISGHGKHGKKQLDPLSIYGIKCHLIYRFKHLSEQDWQRIKLNLDSKCRTAFRRKLKGMPLTVKAFRDKLPPKYVHSGDPESADYSQGSSTNDDDGSQSSVSIDPSQNDSNSSLSAPIFSCKSNILSKSTRSKICIPLVTSVTSLPLKDDNIVSLGVGDSGQHYSADDMVNTTASSLVSLDDKEALVDLVENHTVEMELGLGIDSVAVGIENQSQIFHTLQGGIQVLHATTEQLLEMQKLGELQILPGNHFLHEAGRLQDVLNLSSNTESSISNADFASVAAAAEIKPEMTLKSSLSPPPLLCCSAFKNERES